MSERQAEATERRLWYDGPNYTADAVIVQPHNEMVLLVQRRDTGEWALPGGFIDQADASPRSAAIREAYEEASVTLSDKAPLIFRGVVDDPRNSETAWIETSAYLFETDDTAVAQGGDDALDAGWHSLRQLPPLYASHRMIVDRALDHLEHRTLHNIFHADWTRHTVDGGHMAYEKLLAVSTHQTVFMKRHVDAHFTDAEKAARSQLYLEKEAHTLTHLRGAGFTSIPTRSMFSNNTLVMDAFLQRDGWQWRANQETFDQYVHDALSAFSRLEVMPQPADSFAIEPSLVSFHTEGWHALDRDELGRSVETFLPRLTEQTQRAAQELLADLPLLQRLSRQPRRASQLVMCHHDMRQSNMAWHEKEGVKLIDWSWAGLGESGSDATTLLIDLHKSGFDVAPYREHVNLQHCFVMLGFWLAHSTWPMAPKTDVRLQQFVSALSAYAILRSP